MKVYHYDAFSDQPNRGNTAGVVLNTEGLTTAQMQAIAAAVGFNETAFIRPSTVADIKLRYFTPKHEMNLCGHGTIASLIALYEQRGGTHIECVETKAGRIDARIDVGPGGVNVTMAQVPAKFVPFEGDVRGLALALGLDPQEIEGDWPIVYGNTGIWTLLVPIRHLSSFRKMAPLTPSFPGLLRQFEQASIHPFCLETHRPWADMHGRHFSSPYSGTIEDPVTGTASGVMGAYYLKYIGKVTSQTLVVEQGQEMGKDGLVGVNVSIHKGQIEVEIEGGGVFVKEMEVSL